MTILTTAQEEYLKNRGINLVYQFGSTATGYTTPHSDIDIGIVLNMPARHEHHTLPLYTDLYQLFTDLFRRSDVDVVLLQFAPIAIQARAVQAGTLLYAATADAPYAYKEYVMKRYADLQPLRYAHQQAILDRI